MGDQVRSNDAQRRVIMQSLFKLETIKFIGGATIVLTAFCIMLDQVLGYVFSLARLGLVILIAVVVSAVLAFFFQFFVKSRKKAPLDSGPSVDSTTPVDRS